MVGHIDGHYLVHLFLDNPVFPGVLSEPIQQFLHLLLTDLPVLLLLMVEIGLVHVILGGRMGLNFVVYFYALFVGWDASHGPLVLRLLSLSL